MTKLSGVDFSFAVERRSNGVHTTLTQVSSGKSKAFFQAAGTVEGMTRHMNSLTDRQCGDFLKGETK